MFFGLRIPEPSQIYARQVIQHARHIGMVGSEGLLVDLQRPVKERFGVVELTLVGIQEAQVVLRARQQRMIGAQRLFPYLARPPPELLGLTDQTPGACEFCEFI